MNRKELIKKYLEFFESKEHKIIPNTSLIPENDPTVLFTTAGMHPLVPFLLGEKHPSGKKLVSLQKCIRTGDIEEVGDNCHHTFIEMLGNWSLGDYWKKDAIEYSFEFLTKILGISKEKLAVTCFKGDKDAPKDTESSEIWKSLGIKKIKFLGRKDNWWGPAGKTGPCGPDTEMFVKDIEIWNDVFMQYNKDKRLILVDGKHCIYDKNFDINKDLLEIINNFNTHTVLTVNRFREKGRSLVKNYDQTRDTNWEAFSLEEKGIKKDDSKYFKILLKKFNLIPEEVIYFDHDKKNVETASKLGILSKHYTDIKSIKKFIENNLWTFIPLKQKNVDTGMGVERTVAILNGLTDNYLTDIFKPIIQKIEELSGKKYGKDKETTKAMRIIADHIRASVFIIAESITPSNTEQGYVLRRLIRRAVRYGKKLNMKNFTTQTAELVFEVFDDYLKLKQNKKNILDELKKEEDKFLITLEKGLNRFKKFTSKKKQLSGKDAFLLYQSFGFPIEMVEEECKKQKIKFSTKDFEKSNKEHQQLSRTATAGRFKSGLADHSELTTKLHTTAHLLLTALRIILKDKNIIQKGSNITPERLRLDFSFPRKLTEKELKNIEDLVNAQIQKSCEVTKKEMSPQKAKKSGAVGSFDEKYGDKVSVYSIGNFSKEICAGPHVKNTKELGHFKIKKQESVGAGARRIKATLE